MQGGLIMSVIKPYQIKICCPRCRKPVKTIKPALCEICKEWIEKTN